MAHGRSRRASTDTPAGGRADDPLRPFPAPLYVTRPLLPPLEDFQDRLAEVWKARWLTNAGAQHERLEEALRRRLGVEQLSLFNNGTIALITAIQALRLTGEVVTTPFTFPATAHVLTWNGIRPVFCDIDDRTMNIDPERVEAAITPSTTGILAVHVYGNPCDVAALEDIGRRRGLKVVYDAAHAFGTSIGGVPIGRFGDASMFSFHATKLFHTAEGGALAVGDAETKRRIDLLKNFGIKDEDEVLLPGINGKMSELQAALGLSVLEHVDGEIAARRQIVAVYDGVLDGAPGITLPPRPVGVETTHQYYAIRVDAAFGCTRDELHGELRSRNVITRKYFRPLCSDYQCYRGLPSSSPTNLAVARRVVQEVLCLPVYGDLAIEDAERVGRMILELGRRKRGGARA